MTEEEKKHQKELWRQDRIRARREEWKKIRTLGPGARLRYFWDYYKIVLVIAAMAIFAVYLTFTVIRGIRTDTLLYVCVVNSNVLDPDTEHLTDDYIQARGGIGNMQEIQFDSSLYIDPEASGTSQQDVAASMKIAAFTASASMDVFLTPPNVAAYEQESGMYMALDELLTEDEIERLGSEDCLYYAAEPETELLPDLPDETLDETETILKKKAETGDVEGAFSLNTAKGDGMGIYAVRVDQAGVIGNYSIYADTPVWFSIIANAPHTEEAVRFLHFLLGEEGGNEHE